MGLIPGSGRSPGEGSGNPLQYSRLGNPIDRGLVGYNPWGHKELDTLSDLAHAYTHTHTYIYTHIHCYYFQSYSYFFKGNKLFI